MKTTILLYIIVYLQCCLSKNHDKQHTYSYNGVMLTKTSASSAISKWTISGQLIYQEKADGLIFQLFDLKTSLYNGLTKYEDQAVEKDITDEAKILLEPFFLDSENHRIFVSENETLWSLNMKRSLVNIFLLDTRLIFSDSRQSEIEETALFGKCNVTYNVQNHDDKTIIIDKIYDNKNCKENHLIFTNAQDLPFQQNFEPLTQTTIYSYTIKNNDLLNYISNVEVLQNVTYQSMPDDKFIMSIEQRQSLQLIQGEQKDLDGSKNTESKSLIYEFGKDSTNDRKLPDTDPVKLTEKFIDNNKMFTEQYNSQFLQNFDLKSTDYIEEMFFNLMNMQDNGLETIKNKIIEKNDTHLSHMFLSLLPYIGTNETVKLIIDIIENDLLETILYDRLHLLATFPNYIRTPSEEMLDDMKKLLDLTVNSNFTRNTAILSFATLVAKFKSKDVISNEKFEHYKNLYYDRYSNLPNNNSERTIYMLGLINMAEYLPTDFIISLVTNTSERNSIRTLATYGFKTKLISDPNTVYKIFWPIVQNKSELFNVRVASLDLLLSSELSEEQFNEMVEFYEKYQNDSDDQHLTNYFYTTLVSIQNSTKYFDPLGSMATSTLKTKNIPNYLKAWTTGNYRLAYTDSTPNLGRLLQAQLIADPRTNAVNTLQISYNSFALSKNLGTYTFHIQCDKLLEDAFQTIFMRTFDIFEKLQTNSLHFEDLEKILEDYKFPNKDHITIECDYALFIDNKAVFAGYYNEDLIPAPTEDLFDDFKFLENGLSFISYPFVDYTRLVSSFGTEIDVTTDFQQIVKPKMENGYSCRSYWYHQSWLEAYVPVVDGKLNSFKYIGREFLLSYWLKRGNRPNKNLINFSIENIQSNFSSIDDNRAGTAIYEQKTLEKYCSKCDIVSEISVEEYDEPSKLITLLPNTVMNTTKFSTFTRAINPLNKIDDALEFLHAHLTQDFFSPLTKPLLIIQHYIDNNNYFLTQISKEYREILTVPNYKIVLQLDRTEIFNVPFQNDTIKFNLVLFDKNSTDNVIKPFNFTYIGRRDLESSIKYSNKIYLDFVTRIYNRTKICLDSNYIIPNIPLDKYSIVPLADTEKNMTITYSVMVPYEDNSDDCDKNNCITLSEDLSKQEANINRIKNTDEYKTCRKESENYKYTPPTKACLQTREEMLKYSNYNLYGDITDFAQMHTEIKNRDKFPIIKSKRVNSNIFEVTIPAEFLNLFASRFEEIEEYLTFNISSRIVDQIFLNPNYQAYSDDYTLLGLSSTCTITPSQIKNFAGKFLLNYENNAENVALIECVDYPLNSLTFKKENDKIIQLKLRNMNNAIIITKDGDTVKVMFNNKEIKDDYNDLDEKISIKFLSENVIYVTTTFIQIYYNTEYVSVKIFAIYNNLLCGLCVED